MANVIKIKRTSVTGRAANTTTLPNAGELALNMADGILYSTNGTNVFEIGANNTNVKVSNTINVGNSVVNVSINSTSFSGTANNSTYLGGVVANGYQTTAGLAANVATLAANSATYLGSSINSGNSTGIYSTGKITASDIVSGLELTSTLASGDEGGQINLAKPPNATTLGGVTIDAYQNKVRIFEQGGNARGAYIDLTACANGVGTSLLGGTGTVTNVASGSGLTGGPITTTGTLSVLANTGIVANTTGVYVNAAYINTISSNSATYIGGNTVSDLNTYADNKAANAYSNAVSYASSAAANAYSNATSYADNKAANAYSNATSYADNKAANAYSNAVSYADNKAANAYSNATSYSSNASNISSGTVAEARLPYRMNQNVRTSDTVEFAGMTLTGNLVVSGNVNIIGANNLSISDNMIYLNANNDISNPDLGIAANYNDGTYAHTGIFRDATDGYWKVFDSYLPEPDANVYIDTTNTSFHIANFWANSINLGNTSVYAVINTSNYTGTANNASYLGGTAAASYQLNSTLAANVATLAANSATYVLANTGIVSNSLGVFVNSAYINTISSNNASYLGGVAASGYANTSNPVFTTSVTVGNSTVNVVIDSSTLKINGETAVGQTAIAAGTYGNSTAIPVITLDKFGRVTTISTSAGGSGAFPTGDYGDLTSIVQDPFGVNIIDITQFDCGAAGAIATQDLGTAGSI